MASVVVGGIVGAAFGPVFTELHEAVRHVIRESRLSDEVLGRFKSMLDRVEPMVREMQQLNSGFDRSEAVTNRLIQKMEKGKQILEKYSKLGWWNYPKRSYYAKKFHRLGASLHDFFNVDLPVLGVVNGMETFRVVSDIKDRMKLDERTSILPCAIPGCPDFSVGLDVPLQELKIQLLRQERSMLVLSAPGGCGKTTLAKMLCHDPDIQEMFKDNILFVPISKTPNLKVIVQKLFVHKDNPAPEFQNDEDALNQLQQLLIQSGKYPTLLILDDVWSGSENLLEMIAFCKKDYKVLVTSRNVFPKFGSTYKLKPLNDVDAMTLFCHSATSEDGSFDNPGGDIVKRIVGGCGGFPLALKVVGRSLCQQPTAVWLSREMSLSNGQSFLDFHDELLLRLQSSLYFKGEELILKECFMDLGSFPEDQRIPVAALVDMWSELHELDEGGIQTIANLHGLTIRNLADLIDTRKDASEIGCYCCEDFVILHDLLRELAIHESSQGPIEHRKRLIIDISGNNLPKWWTNWRQQAISAQLLSISTDERFSSSWCNIQPLEVEVLVLNFSTKNYMLPEFVEKMGRLKVLIATNHGFFPTEIGNFHLLESAPYLKKIRLEKVSIPSLCKTPVWLRSLKKISLFMCNIGQAFRKCDIQVSDALPELIEVNIDYCNDLVELPIGLCDLVRLKKLSITNCHKLSVLPQGIENLRNLEVLRLRSCTDLWELPEPITNLHGLRILDISDCSSITKLPKHIGALCCLEQLHMKGCSRLRGLLPSSAADLEKLKLVICDVEMVKFWKHMELHPGLEIKGVEKDISLNWLYNRL